MATQDAKSNTLRTYYALDESMMTAHRKDDDASRADAERTARILLENSDLPLLLRARACMVLGCSEEPDYLKWAAEGVRVAKLGHSLCAKPGEVENDLVEDCETVLREATERHEATSGETAEEVDADDGENEDEDEDEGEVTIETVWDPAWEQKPGAKGEGQKTSEEVEKKR